MRPQPERFPITETTIGVSESAQIRGVTELHFPSKFENVACVVENLRYELGSMQQLSLKIDFKLTSLGGDLSDLYEEEDWKVMTTKFAIEHLQGQVPSFKNPVPIFALMLSKYLRVSSARLKISGKESPIMFDQASDILLLPDSYPPLCNLPAEETYSYYDKKSTAFYADFFLDTKYSLEIEFESCGTFENVPFFPFPKVTINKVEYSSNCDLEVQGFCNLVEPMRERAFPEWVEYKLAKLTSIEPVPPLKMPAFPFRGEETLFNPIEGFTRKLQKTGEIPEIPEDYFKLPESINALKVDNYQALRFCFAIHIPPHKKFDIIVRVIQRPIPARIYEQMQSLPNYRDFLVEYDIINFSDRKVRLRVETEISGYTEKEAKTIFIHHTNNNANQRARGKLAQCPRLKKDVLESIVNPQKATMLCKVKDEDTKEVLYEQTFNVDFLPHDQVIWSIRDVRNDHFYQLGSLVCAWVHPNDKNGLLDKVRTGAVKYSANGYLGAEIKSLEDIEEHARVLYEYLQKDIGISYVNQPFTAFNENESQRVILPEKVLENKAGNCIDLTVLFASLLEGFGINSLIFLTENHAFIGWGNPKKTSEMFFLETTMVGTASFDEAMKVGEENFKENFLLIGSEDPIPGLLPSMKSRQIVDLGEARKQGIVSHI